MTIAYMLQLHINLAFQVIRIYRKHTTRNTVTGNVWIL